MKLSEKMHANMANQMQVDEPTDDSNEVSPNDNTKEKLTSDTDEPKDESEDVNTNDNTGEKLQSGSDLPSNAVDDTINTQIKDESKNKLSNFEKSWVINADALTTKLTKIAKDIEVPPMADADLNGKTTIVDNFNLGGICLKAILAVGKNNPKRSICMDVCKNTGKDGLTITKCIGCVKLQKAKVCLEMLEYVNEYTGCLEKSTKDNCKQQFPTEREGWAIAEDFTQTVGGETYQTYASQVLWDDSKNAGSDRRWWKEKLRFTPMIRRQNTVESGFWANVQMAFNTGWSIGFVPIDWKGLRFFVHDNLPISPYRVNSENGDATSNSDEEKLWNLKTIWENRKLMPMIARFEFFNVGHPVNEKLSMKWLFKREYFPFTG